MAQLMSGVARKHCEQFRIDQSEKRARFASETTVFPELLSFIEQRHHILVHGLWGIWAMTGMPDDSMCVLAMCLCPRGTNETHVSAPCTVNALVVMF